MTIFNRRALISLLATSALALPLPAFAATPAPRFTAVDDHGVDMVLGLPYVTIDEGGIGSGPGALRMQRIYAGGAGFVDNWSGGVYQVTTGSVTKAYVRIAGISETFTGSGTTWTAEKGNGATLSAGSIAGRLLYTARDGTKYEFDQEHSNPDFYSNSCPGGDADSCQAPISIVRPDGLKFTYVWTTQRICHNLPGENCATFEVYKRLSSIRSSAGYSLTFSYASDVVGDANYFQRTGVSFNNSANPPSPAPTISYAYPSATVTNITDPAGRTWVLTSDANGRLTGIRRPGSASDNVTYAYTNGLVSSATKDGVTDTYSVPTAGQYKSVDPLLHATTVTIDTAHGRLSSVKDAANNTVSYLYDGNDRLQRVTQPEGKYVTYGYDSRGNVQATTVFGKAGSTPASIGTSASFPASCTNQVTCNKPSTTTDAKGNVTDYTYDANHGGMLTVTAAAPTSGAARPQTRYSYTPVASASGDTVTMLSGVAACPSASSCTAANEISQSASFNSNLLPTVVTKGNSSGTVSASSTIAYDPRGNVESVDGPLTGNADTTKYIYDVADQLTGVISSDPDGSGTLKMRAIRVTYRPDGQVSKRELGNVISQTSAALTGMTALQTVDVGFDSNSRAVTQKLSAGGTAFALTQTGYDNDGRVSCVAQRLNPAVFGSLPAACSLSTQGSDGPDQITQTSYDPVDRVAGISVGVATAAAATERVLTYTADGQMQTLTDGNNNKTTYVYDGYDRLYQTQYPSVTKGAGTSNASDFEQLGYDANGNVISRRLRDTTSIAFTYDNLNRVTLKNLPGTEPDVTYAYDNLGRITDASQTGNALSFTWDALSRMTDQGGPNGSMHSDFDNAGRRIKLTYADAGLFVNYDWLVTGEIDKIRENNATSGVGVLAAYGYDQLGSMTSKAFGNGVVQTYAFDPISRLNMLTNDLSGTSDDLTIGGSTTPIIYNAASQITKTSRAGDSYPFTALVNSNRIYVSNGLNQFVSSTLGGVITSYSYDLKGNFTSDGTSTFGYSSEDLLETGPNGSTLTYDPLMRLNQLTSAGSTTRWGYDGLNMIAEYSGSNALLRRHVFGPGLDQPVVTYEGNSVSSTTRRFLSADERGSIIAVSDSAGAKLSTNGYDEYGMPQSPASAAAGSAGQGNVYGRFGYTGQAWLPELGLYYYKARMYSPLLGRFFQPDPVGYAEQANLHAYGQNDPVNRSDSLGLQSETDLDTPIVITACQNGGYRAADGSCYNPADDFGIGGGLGVGGTSDGGSEEGGDAPIEVIGHRPSQTPVPHGPGTPYTAESPQQQQKNCSTNPITSRALANPGFQRAIRDAVSSTLSSVGGWEYGFWGRVSSNGQVQTWNGGTSRDFWMVNPGSISPYFSNILLWSISAPNVFDHTHIPDSPLSQEDVDFATRNKVSIIASSDQGRNYCYPSN